MTAIDHERLSRVVSHALRHEPWLYELELDEEGWTDIDSVLTALRSEGPSWSALSEAHLVAMIARSSKARHEMRDGQIRALYGHSLPGKLKKTMAAPPEQLFHGTSPKVLAEIKVTGLRPMGRQYVHLSVDRNMAVAVGRRKSREPMVLIIAAAQANAAGHSFYLGNDKVWLADNIPPTFITFGG
ncbi:MAG TPA: RNA 2'-phosphotransferase [Dongiaceae bacterium]|jgi:putative RNA 2'-phosphotransferase|nr:RNA 2'-phosphotransferase [Dongiaceae bacterium]